MKSLHSARLFPSPAWRVGAWCFTALFVCAAPAVACVGDCNGDTEVRIEELITGVNMALGTTPVSTCSAFDRDSNGEVRINELLAGVNADKPTQTM